MLNLFQHNYLSYIAIVRYNKLCYRGNTLQNIINFNRLAIDPHVFHYGCIIL